MSTSSVLEWTSSPDGTATAHLDEMIIGTVTRAAPFLVASTDGTLTGQHNTLDNGKAQLEAWHRWRLHHTPRN